MGEYFNLGELEDFKKEKGISMLNLNIGSVNTHSSELKLKCGDNKIDIINICETWLKKDSDLEIFKLDGYNVIRQDRDTKTSGGGLISYIDKRLKFNEEKYKDLNTNHKDFELLIYEILLPNTRPIVILSCYKPPHIKLDLALEKLTTTLDKIDGNTEIYLVGDINVCYGLGKGNNYRKIKHFEHKNLLTQHIKTTTCPKPNSQRVIDHIYSNSNNILKTGTIKWQPADHLATGLIRKQVKIIKEKSTVVARRATDFDVDSIEIEFENKNWSNFLDSKNVDQKWEILLRHITEVMDDKCPVREFQRTVAREKWINDELLELVDLRDSAIKKALRTKRDVDWETAKTIRKETRNNVEKAKNDYIKETLKENEKDPRKFWKKVTPRINQKKAKFSYGSQALDNIASRTLANKFNTFFSTVGKVLDNELEKYDSTKHPFQQHTKENLPKFRIKKVTEDTVLKHIEKIDIYKSSEIEDLSTFFLKGSLKILVKEMTDIINTSIETGEVPKAWKIGRLSPIYKGTGKKEETGNYRPISLLPLPSKILEKVINDQVKTFIEENHLYSENQYGFRSSLSTNDAIEKVVSQIIVKQNAGLHVSATFLDLKKAFDVVNHELMLKKLKTQYNFDDKAVKWFKNYLSDRHQYTKINGEMSGVQKISCGVPQGSILGPTLFTLYVNDVEKVFTNSSVYLYADDTVVLSFHEDPNTLIEKLNADMIYYHHWLLYNRLTVNTKKSNFILFKGYGQSINCKLKKVKLGKDEITRTQCYKYLGLVLDERLTFEPHVKKVSRDVNYRLNRLFKFRPSITENTAAQIYKVMILPLIDYADIVYATGNKDNLKRLRIIQNKALRIIGKLRKRTNTDELARKLAIEDLKKRRLMHMLQYAHKISHRHKELKNIKKTTRYNSGKYILMTQSVKSDTYAKSFDYKSRVHWNALSKYVHEMRDKKTFNIHIKANLDNLYTKLCKD